MLTDYEAHHLPVWYFGGMEIDEIKKAILALPDAEIEPLFKWLQEYYDGPVWDRQLNADFAQLGHEGICRLMDCPLTGPVPTMDLEDAINEMRRRRGLPPIVFPTANDETNNNG